MYAEAAGPEGPLLYIWQSLWSSQGITKLRIIKVGVKNIKATAKTILTASNHYHIIGLA